MTTSNSNGSNRLWLVLGGIAVVAVSAGYYLHSRGYESTDNASLEAAVVQLSSRVPGQVVKVHISDNQPVKKGDVLVELDPRDFEAQLEAARARLADAEARHAAASAGLRQTAQATSAQLTQAGAGVGMSKEQVQLLEARLKADEAGVNAAEAARRQAEARHSAAEAESARAKADAARYKALYQKDEVSKQSLDRAETDAKAASANADAAHQLVAAAEAQQHQALAALASTRAALRQGQRQTQQSEGRLKEAQTGPLLVEARAAELKALEATIRQLQAGVQQAELNLSYTKITAPEDGLITRKAVEPGVFLQPGQAIGALVSERLWVVANFKETQLTRMRPGQSVHIKVDAYPQVKLQGRIDSIQAGTGARFSLLPAENATGNFVKVVQRVPVKILLTAKPPAGIKLGPGMSVEPEVELQ